MKLARLLVLALLPLGCVASRSEPAPAAPRQIAQLQDARLKELSGLAASRCFSGCFWAHNDSGDSARLFLIDIAGRTRAVVNFAGIEAIDWEDITVAGVGENASVIVADSGDNSRARPEIVLRRFRERDLKLQVLEDAPAPEITIEAQSLTLHYPEADGAQDCEALAANDGGDLLLVTKSTAPSRFYLARWPLDEKSGAQELKFVGEKQFGSTEPGKRRVREQLVTGAELSPDGARLALVTYAELFVWKLPPGAWSGVDWKQVLANPPSIATLPKLPQCESVAWLSANEVLVSSEGENAPLWSVRAP
jgi:hypothetical protein